MLVARYIAAVIVGLVPWLGTCLTAQVLYADDDIIVEKRFLEASALPEGIVNGTVQQIMKSDKEDHIIIKLKTASKMTYLELLYSDKKNLKIGTQYEFYPLYLKRENVKLKNQTIPEVFSSFGVVLPKYKQQSKFNFQELVMGNKSPDNIDNLKQTVAKADPEASVKVTTDNYGANVISVENYHIGKMPFNISITPDYFDKILDFHFEYLDTVKDQENAEKILEVLCGVLKKRYNLEESKFAKKPGGLANATVYCEWNYGNLRVIAGYKEEKRQLKVFARLQDLPRGVQTHNIHMGAYKKQLEYYLIKKYTQEGVEREKQVNEGAKSF